MIIRLSRHELSAYGTFGTLIVPGKPPLCTVERAWQPFAAAGSKRFDAGVPFESCVPPGLYRLEWYKSPKYGFAWHLVSDDVTLTQAEGGERFACLFHAANWPDQVQGCVAPGLTFAYVLGRWGVSDSSKAIERLHDWLPRNAPHELVIAA